MGSGFSFTQEKVTYVIIFTRTAQKQIKNLPRIMTRVVQNALSALSKDPFPPDTKRMHGYDAYRIRIGNYRILYEVKTTIRVIRIIRVGDRKNIYRQL